MSQSRTVLPEVVITRARADAATWAQALQQAGFKVSCEPLLDLEDMPLDELKLDVSALTTARAIMVVSARAAGAFARADLGLLDALQPVWSAGLGPRLWAPGLGTVKALLAAGVPEAQIDSPPPDAAQFDSEHLWPMVKNQIAPKDTVVFFRGEGAAAGTGRDFLAQRCLDAGGQVETALVYRRGRPQWTAQEQAEALRLWGDPRAVWLFSSSLAAQHLDQWRQSLRQPLSQQVHVGPRGSALATHERIAQTLCGLGWRHVEEATPRLEDIIRVLQTSFDVGLQGT